MCRWHASTDHDNPSPPPSRPFLGREDLQSGGPPPGQDGFHPLFAAVFGQHRVPAAQRCTSRKQACAFAAQGCISESQGRVFDAQGRVSDAQGRASNAQGRVSDAQGRASNAQGRVSDAQGRASDAQGHASDAQACVRGMQRRASDVRRRRLAPSRQQHRDHRDDRQCRAGAFYGTVFGWPIRKRRRDRPAPRRRRPGNYGAISRSWRERVGTLPAA